MYRVDDFYTLSADAQAERMLDLAKLALARWEGEFSRLSLIKYRENAVFSVWNDKGERFALRIHRHDYHTDAELLSELQWMEALHASGIGAPPTIAAADGSLFVLVKSPSIPEPRQIDMLGWLDGAPVGAIEEERIMDEPETAALYMDIGELAGTVHNQSSSWTRPSGFQRHAWDLEGLIGDDPFWGRFLELPALNNEQRALIARAVELAHEELVQLGTGNQVYGLIHADFVPENLIKRDDGLVLIDFDDCGFGWYMFELATALYFYVDDPSFPVMRDAIVEGYRRVRPLPDAEWDRLPLFLFLRSLTYLGWVHTRHETETARELTPMFVDRTMRLAEAYLGQCTSRLAV